jgi:hypothetical protein
MSTVLACQARVIDATPSDRQPTGAAVPRNHHDFE